MLAKFIYDAANAIDEAYWFSIRGECDASLCVHTMLSMDEYCKLLFLAGLVKIGKSSIEMSKEDWLQYLRDEGICPELRAV